MRRGGERLFINLQLVDFGSGNATQGFFSNVSFANAAEEYAEFIAEVVKHLDDKYGIVPDALELVLEPDNTVEWTGTTAVMAARLNAALLAVHARLTANGYTIDQYIAPGTKSIQTAWKIIDEMVKNAQVLSLLDVFSYHLYSHRSNANRQEIWNRAVLYGKKTAQLELTGAIASTIMEDTEYAHSSAFQRWALIANHVSGYLNPDVTDPNSPTFAFNNYVAPMVQFMKYVRIGALEIEASGTNAVAYIGKNGGYTVIFQNPTGDYGPFTITGLPAGTYGVTSSGHNSSNTYKHELAYSDLTITAGQDLVFSVSTASTWLDSIVTVFQKSGANMDTVPPSAPTNLLTNPVSPTQIDLSWTAATDNVAVTGYDIYRDGSLYKNVGTTSFSDAVAPASVHLYEVRARDAAGNISSLTPASTAGTQGDVLQSTLAYVNHGTYIQITSCPSSSVGGIRIPDTLEGLPVTRIADNAFINANQLTAVYIPEGVTHIGDQAFLNCTSLRWLRLPTTLTQIGTSAFKNCTKLRAVSLPTSLTVIPDSAFLNCSALREVNFTSVLTTIGQSAFENCTNLREIPLPSSLTSIGGSAFRNTAAFSFSIGPNVALIGEAAFADCPYLVSLDVDPANAQFSSVNRTLYNKTKTVLLGYPIAVPDPPLIQSSVVSISRRAFSGAMKFTQLTLPANLTSIAEEAFQNCRHLLDVVFPANLVSLGKHAFKDCSDLLQAEFLGHEPWIPLAANAQPEPVFVGVNSAFEIYYYAHRLGFGSPTWLGHPTVVLGGVTDFADWLSQNGLPPTFDPLTDTNDDGVSILMEVALNLSPNINNASRLPQAVRNGNTIEIEFYAQTPGITYVAEASPNMGTWSTTGVTVTGPDASGTYKASVVIDADSKFVRLRVVN